MQSVPGMMVPGSAAPPPPPGVGVPLAPGLITSSPPMVATLPAAALPAATLPAPTLPAAMLPAGHVLPGAHALPAGHALPGGQLAGQMQALLMQQQQQLLHQQIPMMAQPNPALASQFTLQAVSQAQAFEQASQAFEQAQAATLEPEVTELAHHFKLDERIARDLDMQMKRRKLTIEDDMKAIWEILEGARNPAGLLRVKIRELEEGTFRGTATPDRDVEELSRKFGLDAQASAKLAEVLSKREDRKRDIKQISKHLELSNKPSSLVSMMLKDLRNGVQVKDPEYPAAVGSYAHKRGLKGRPGGGGRGGGGERPAKSRSRSRRRRRRSSSSSSPPEEFKANLAKGLSAAGNKLDSNSASQDGPRPMTLLERFG